MQLKCQDKWWSKFLLFFLINLWGSKKCMLKSSEGNNVMCNTINIVMIAKAGEKKSQVIVIWIFLIGTSHSAPFGYMCVNVHVPIATDISIFHPGNGPVSCFIFQFAVITLHVCAFVHLQRICSVWYTMKTHTHTHRLYFVYVCVHFDSGLLEAFYIKWNHSDWPWLQGPQRDFWEEEKEPRGCVCGERNYTTTCSLSIPLSQLSGPYLALMRCGNTHRHM